MNGYDAGIRACLSLVCFICWVTTVIMIVVMFAGAFLLCMEGGV
jgi:hypothetical protein